MARRLSRQRSPRFNPEDFNLYLNFVFYTVLGGLAQADSLMSEYGTRVKRVARSLRQALGVPKEKCWRGVLLEPSEIPADRMILPQAETTFFSSWSEDKDVACWFADRESSMAWLVRTQRPGVQGWLMELEPKKGDVLFHHSWANRIPVPGGRVSLEQIIARTAPMLAAAMSATGMPTTPEHVRSQVVWNLRTQKEVVLGKIDRKVRVSPYADSGCPPGGLLDGRLTWPEARQNPDEDLRRLEREAEGTEERARLANARLRAGEPVQPWETSVVAQVFLDAYHLGPEGRVEAITHRGKRERFYLCAGRIPDQAVRLGAIYHGADPSTEEILDRTEAAQNAIENGLVCVPQEPVLYDANRRPSSLAYIADMYSLTLQQLWEANVVSDDWGIPPQWRESRGWGRPGHYGARQPFPEDHPIWWTWAWEDVFAPWYRHAAYRSPHLRGAAVYEGFDTPHLAIPPNGRWSALAKTTRQRAGKNDRFWAPGADHMAIDHRNYVSARIMTRKGKAWKNPRSC